MPTAHVNGTNLYYEESGQGPHMLFIHGMCGDASVWANQRERLSSHFHCVAYDRRGHSRSPRGPIAPRPVELHADDAAQLIVELGLAPCILVGSSGGARIALDVLRRYPRLVERAALSEPPAFGLDPALGQAFMDDVMPAVQDALASGGPRAAVDVFFEIACPGLWNRLSEERRNTPYRANAAEMVDEFSSPPYQITPADLEQIRRPCLIIRGSESLLFLRAITDILVKHLPDAQLVELAGSGHVTYAEQPAEFAAAVEAFALANLKR